MILAKPPPPFVAAADAIISKTIRENGSATFQAACWYVSLLPQKSDALALILVTVGTQKIDDLFQQTDLM